MRVQECELCGERLADARGVAEGASNIALVRYELGTHDIVCTRTPHQFGKFFSHEIKTTTVPISSVREVHFHTLYDGGAGRNVLDISWSDGYWRIPKDFYGRDFSSLLGDPLRQYGLDEVAVDDKTRLHMGLVETRREPHNLTPPLTHPDGTPSDETGTRAAHSAPEDPP